MRVSKLVTRGTFLDKEPTNLSFCIVTETWARTGSENFPEIYSIMRLFWKKCKYFLLSYSALHRTVRTERGWAVLVLFFVFNFSEFYVRFPYLCSCPNSKHLWLDGLVFCDSILINIVHNTKGPSKRVKHVLATRFYDVGWCFTMF